MKFITLDEMLSYFDEQHPNQHSREEKITWISEIDERIYDEIIVPRLPLCFCPITLVESDIGKTVTVYLTIYDYNRMIGEYEPTQIGTAISFEVTSNDVGKTFGTLNFNGYEDDTNGETILLVPSMFKDVYRYWMEKNSNIKNREIGAANNAMAIFQTYYDDFFANYNRHHKVTKTKRIRDWGL